MRLFGFYDHILPMLKKIGAYENLTRSKEYIFIHERGTIHRFDLRTWPATYRGFTVPESCSYSRPRLRSASSCSMSSERAWACSLLMMSAICERSRASTACRNRYCKAGFSGNSTKPPSMRRRNSPQRSRSSRSTKSSPSAGTTTSTRPRRKASLLRCNAISLECCRGRIEFNHKLTQVRTDEVGAPGTGARFRASGHGRSGCGQGRRICACDWA